MTISPVVSPTVKGPGVYFGVNPQGGAPSPGTAGLRALVMATKSATGTITADTELIEGVTKETAKTHFGIGTPGALACKRIFEEHPTAKVDIVSPAVNGSAVDATGVITFSGTVTAAHTIRAYISGRRVEFVWAAGVTAQAAAEGLRDKVNAVGEEMPVVATAAINGGGPDWDTVLTSRVGGPIGNDITVFVEVIGGAGGTVTGPATNKLTSGAGEPDYANALTTVASREYDLRLNCCSNADAQDGGSSSNPGKVKTQINQNITGLNAKMQQQVVGLTGALTAAKTGAAAMNHEWSQYTFCLNGQSLPCEFGGAELGARLREEELKPNKNRISMEYRATLYGPYDTNADKPDPETEIEDALDNGVSITDFSPSGVFWPSRPCTTYHEDAQSNPDDRVFDVGIPSGLAAIAKDLRSFLPEEFKGKNLSPDLEPGDDPPPEGVVELREIKAGVNSRIRFWIRRGVVRADLWAQSVAEGTFAVQINPSDDSQVDMVLPARIVKPLAKFGVDLRNGA